MGAGGHWGLSGLQGQLEGGQRGLACREGFGGAGRRELRSKNLKPLRELIRAWGGLPVPGTSTLKACHTGVPRMRMGFP